MILDSIVLEALQGILLLSILWVAVFHVWQHPRLRTVGTAVLIAGLCLLVFGTGIDIVDDFWRAWQTALLKKLVGYNGGICLIALGVYSWVPELTHAKNEFILRQERLKVLSHREREVLAAVTKGCSNQKTADLLQLTPKTVENYLGRIYAKIGVTNRVEATIFCSQSSQ